MNQFYVSKFKARDCTLIANKITQELPRRRRKRECENRVKYKQGGKTETEGGRVERGDKRITSELQFICLSIIFAYQTSKSAANNATHDNRLKRLSPSLSLYLSPSYLPILSLCLSLKSQQCMSFCFKSRLVTTFLFIYFDFDFD